MNTLQHEQRLVRMATLCSKCTTAEEVILELESFLPYLLQFGGIKDVIKYASAFKTLDFRKVSEETREASRKRIEVDDAWHTVNAENAAYFEHLVDLQEEDALNRTLEEYDQYDYDMYKGFALSDKVRHEEERMESIAKSRTNFNTAKEINDFEANKEELLLKVRFQEIAEQAVKKFVKLETIFKFFDVYKVSAEHQCIFWNSYNYWKNRW